MDPHPAWPSTPMATGSWWTMQTDDGIYRSTDDGQTWSAEIPLSTANAHPRGIAVDTNGDWLVVDSSDDGIYRSTDDGQTWSAEIPLSTANAQPTIGMAVDTNGDWLVVDLMTDDGIYRSTDDGQTWSAEIPLSTANGNPSGIRRRHQWRLARGGLRVESCERRMAFTVRQMMGQTWSAEIPLSTANAQPQRLSQAAWPSTPMATGSWWMNAMTDDDGHLRWRSAQPFYQKGSILRKNTGSGYDVIYRGA